MRFISQNHLQQKIANCPSTDNPRASVALPPLLTCPFDCCIPPTVIPPRRGSAPRHYSKELSRYTSDNFFSSNPSAVDPAPHFRLALTPRGRARRTASTIAPTHPLLCVSGGNLTPVSINYFDYNIIHVEEGERGSGGDRTLTESH